jgi:hypothetical protein
MIIEWVAAPIGLLCGALVLYCVYLLAVRKAQKTGERPLVVFFRVLAVFMLLHGLGLAFITPGVWFAASTFIGPLPAEDAGMMAYFTVVGFVVVIVSVGVLCWTGLFPRVDRPTS